MLNRMTGPLLFVALVLAIGYFITDSIVRFGWWALVVMPIGMLVLTVALLICMVLRDTAERLK